MTTINNISQQSQTPQQSRRPWLVSSPTYQVFVDICVKAGWGTREHLPRAGSKDARESGFEAFIAAGLGGNIPFSRAQVNAKFKHWKQSLESEERIIRSLDESEIASATDLLRQLKKEDVYIYPASKTCCNTTNVTFHNVINGAVGVATFDTFRLKTIEAMNTALTANSHSRKRGSIMYGKLQMENEKWFSEIGFVEAVEATSLPAVLSPQEKGMAMAVGLLLVYEFITLLHVAFKKGDAKSLADHIQATVDTITTANLLPEDVLLLETWYYVSSWLQFAAQKRLTRCSDKSALKPPLAILVASFEHVTDEQKKGLPTGKVQRTQLHEGKLQMTGPKFFYFVAHLEKICEAVMLPRSIKIYGPSFIDELASIIVSLDIIKEQLKICLGERGVNIDDNGLLELGEYLVSTYLNMRGKDFVRQIMGKKSLTQGTRSELKTLTKHSKGEKGILSNIVICYFCGEAGHGTNECEKMSIRPNNEDIPHCITICKDMKPLKLEWTWCQICDQYKTTHGTATHDDSLVEANEEMHQIDVDDSDEMALLCDEIVECEEIVE
jgi:hypothetical protein